MFRYQHSFFKTQVGTVLPSVKEEPLVCGSVYRAVATAFSNALLSSLGTFSAGALQPHLQSILMLHQELHPYAMMRSGFNTPAMQFKHLFGTTRSHTSFLNDLAQTFYYLVLLGGLKHPPEQLLLPSGYEHSARTIDRNALPILAKQLGMTIVCYTTHARRLIPGRAQYQPDSGASSTQWTLTLWERNGNYQATVRPGKDVCAQLLIPEQAYHRPEEERGFMTHLTKVREMINHKYLDIYERLVAELDRGTIEVERLQALYMETLPITHGFHDDLINTDPRYPVLDALARFAAISPQFNTTLFEEIGSLSVSSVYGV